MHPDVYKFIEALNTFERNAPYPTKDSIALRWLVNTSWAECFFNLTLGDFRRLRQELEQLQGSSDVLSDMLDLENPEDC